jgi:hypothetical protein
LLRRSSWPGREEGGRFDWRYILIQANSGITITTKNRYGENTYGAGKRALS